MQVLLLEDDETVRLIFEECLVLAGHDVIACATVKDALTALRTRKIEMLVMDLMIGNTNSLGLVQYAGYAAPDAEIILITGAPRFTHGEVLADFPNINWFLRKPVPIGDLEAIVDYAEHRRAA